MPRCCSPKLPARCLAVQSTPLSLCSEQDMGQLSGFQELVPWRAEGAARAPHPCAEPAEPGAPGRGRTPARKAGWMAAEAGPVRDPHAARIQRLSSGEDGMPRARAKSPHLQQLDQEGIVHQERRG